jgi:putative phage-type endonuclease
LFAQTKQSEKGGWLQMGISIIQLKDRSEWLQHRRKYIGGSDASCIVGMNPYKTNVELWEEKTGLRTPEDISEKSFVKYGTEAEAYLRELFRLDFPKYKVEYLENNSILCEEYPFAAASLDGMLEEEETGRKGILEIKTTNILQSMQKEKWNHRIPDNYFIQCLHYLAVTNFDFVILKAQLKFDYDGEIFLNTKHYYIDRTEVAEDIKYLMEEEQKFYEHILSGEQPPLVLPEI